MNDKGELNACERFDDKKRIAELEAKLEAAKQGLVAISRMKSFLLMQGVATATLQRIGYYDDGGNDE